MKKNMPSAKPPRGPVPIAHLATGVPGLDAVLGGGIPEFSFNLVAGAPGSGKTTLVMQLVFANSTPERPGLYITLLGEPSLKMLRYQQQFTFFDTDRVGTDVQFLNLSAQVLSGDLDLVFRMIVAEVARINPGIVVIDSFRALVRTGIASDAPNLDLKHFVQRLALLLTSSETTSFLVGDYAEQEVRNPIFTVADGILWLTQAVDRNSVVRKLQVMKMRGMEVLPGLHTMRMNSTGVQVFPRVIARGAKRKHGTRPRLSTGVPGLDLMMGGGIPAGSSMVLAGPTGTGKTTFTTMFVAEGLREGEACIVAVFEEHPEEYTQRALMFGIDFAKAVADNKLRIIYLRPLDLSVDEALEEIMNSAQSIGATRVVLDSTSGFEMALAPTFREDFRESLYRLVSTLTDLGVTMLLTVEVVEKVDGLQFTNDRVSFLTDIILVQRYIELDGALQTVLAIIKMRGSAHSREFRSYEITSNGVLLRGFLRNYTGILSGKPTRTLPRHVTPSGLTDEEGMILEVIVRSGAATLKEIEKSTGARGDLQGSLDRLVNLEYICRKGNLYEGVARSGAS